MNIFTQTYRMGARVGDGASPTGLRKGKLSEVMAETARHDRAKSGDLFIFVNDDNGTIIGSMVLLWDGEPKMFAPEATQGTIKFDRKVGSIMSLDLLMSHPSLEVRQDDAPD